MLYTSILCRVVLFDSIVYLDMEGSSRYMTQLDSDETQPPEVPFDSQPPEVPVDSSDSLLSSKRQLVPGTRDWYVTYTHIPIHNHLYAYKYKSYTYICTGIHTYMRIPIHT